MQKYTIPVLATSWSNDTDHGTILYLGKIRVAAIWYDGTVPAGSTEHHRARLEMAGMGQLKKKHYATEDEAKKACELALNYWVTQKLDANPIN